MNITNFVKQIFVHNEHDSECDLILPLNNNSNRNDRSDRSDNNCILSIGVMNSLSSEDMYYPYEYNRTISNDDIESKGDDEDGSAKGLYYPFAKEMADKKNK